MKAAIVFFSRAGENYFKDGIRRISIGNTQIAAEKLAELIDAPLFPLEMVTPYSENYKECVKEAVRDNKVDARPELKEIPDISEYTDIFLGYPNYCGTMPMPVFTFLSSVSTEKKTIHPFCTNEGSGAGKSAEDIRKLCPKADVKTPLSILGDDVENSENLFSSWI